MECAWLQVTKTLTEMETTMWKKAFGWLLALAFVPQVHAAEKIKIGFIASLSGGQAAVGRELLDGFNLALKGMGGKLGGADVELLLGDDQGKPDVGAQLAEKLVERDRVSIVTGVNLSNVLLAVVQPVFDARRIYLSINAGPSELAGAGCHPNFYNVAHQNDTIPEAMGAHLQAKGIKRLYVMAPNFAAGKDMVRGLKRTFKGEIVGEVYTQFGQLDYSAELAKLRSVKPDALYVFYPGGMGVNFFRQFAQAGLKGQVPVYSTYSTDQTVLPAIGDAALGVVSTAYWSEQLDNSPNRKFVADFEAAYQRIPSPFAAMGYDGARLIDAALRANGGKFGNAEAFGKALGSAKFESVRGDFQFNRNHFPIQSHYLLEVTKDEKGRLVNAVRGLVNSAYQDAYVGECKMQVAVR